jgi:hypothetical protein
MTYGQLLAKLQKLTPAQKKQSCLVIDPLDMECFDLASLETIKEPAPNDAITKGRVVLKASTFV